MRFFAPTLVTLALAGCAVGTLPAPPTPVPTATGTPVPAATNTPTPVPTQEVSPSRLTHGTLYGPYGQPIHEPAVVHVVAPDGSFDQTTTAVEGHWQMADVPAGKLQVSATVDGWPVRIRDLAEVTYAATISAAGAEVPTAREINFGGPYNPRMELDM